MIWFLTSPKSIPNPATVFEVVKVNSYQSIWQLRHNIGVRVLLEYYVDWNDKIAFEENRTLLCVVVAFRAEQQHEANRTN
jgi:hypothetical protein